MSTFQIQMDFFEGKILLHQEDSSEAIMGTKKKMEEKVTVT